MSYLGKSDRSKNDKLKAEESFPISDGTECQLLLFSVRVWVLSCASLIKPSIYPIFDFLPLFPGFLLLLSLRVTYIKQSKTRLVLNSNK